MHEDIDESLFKQYETQDLPDDHEAIVVDHGVQKILSLRWDVSETTLGRYLRGQYTHQNPHYDLIKMIRADARAVANGIGYYVAADKDGTLHAFLNPPRRDNIQGKWFNPMDRLTKHDIFRPEFPDYFLPTGVRLKFESNFIKVFIKVLW